MFTNAQENLLHRNTLDNMLEGVQIHDFDLRYIYVNDALVRLGPYTREEMIGHTLMEKYPGIEQTELYKKISNCLHNRCADQFETEFIFPDGRTAYFELLINSLPEGICILSLDRTEQRAAKEAVLENENRFRALVENGVDMITLSTLKGEMRYASPSVTKVFGYTLEEIRHLSAFDFVHPDDLGKFLTDRSMILKTNRTSCYTQLRLLHKKGHWVWCESTLTNMLEEKGIHALVANFRDITERITAETAQRESQELIQTIYDAAPDAVIIIDSSGIITRWDDKSATLFGWKEAEVLNASLSRVIIPQRYRSRHEAGMQHYMKTGEGNILHKSIDIAALKKDGSELEVSLSIRPTHIDGQIHFIGFIRDISDKKNAEKLKEFEQNNLTALINNTKDLLWSVDREFKLITSNQPFTDVIFYMSGKTIARETDMFAMGFPAEQMMRYKQYYERAFDGEIFTVTEFTDSPVKFWSEISFSPIFKGEYIIGTACHSRDITERKTAEREKEKMMHELANAREQEQLAVTDAVIAGEEQARQYMGLELHDNINQILATAQLYLGMFLQKNPAPDHLILKTEKMIITAIKEIRDLAHSTISPFLETDTLPTAIETLIAITERTGTVKITRSFTDIEQIPIPGKLKLTLYRVVQEQFQNILKHAGARNIYLKLHCENYIVSLSISDDGVGFDTSKKAAGIGMKNIRTRISLYEGTLNIISSPGNGCSLQVKCRYPCTG